MGKTLSRREFLQNSAKNVAGLLVTGASLPLLASACTTAEETESARTVSTASLIDLGTVEELEEGVC